MHKYGHFNTPAREYVITEPLTPRPWINYLSNGKMGAFVSQGAGGLAWYDQAESRRISRYDFMGLPEDRPGFYIYIREQDGSYWNPSFQPSQTPLCSWECRQGMGYTTFAAEHKGINTELTLFVPVNDDVLLLDLKVTNNRSETEKLFIANYLEFSLFEYFKEIIGWIVLRNQVQFLYDKEHNCIKYNYFVHEAAYTNPVFISGSATADGYDCDRSAFIGQGRDTSNPIAIENGKLSNSELPGGGLGVGCLGYDIELSPGETQRITWTIGTADSWDDASKVMEKFKQPANIDSAKEELASFWENMLNQYQVDIPDNDIQNMINTWNPYGAYTTFFRDRDISSELPGFTSGIRFRDGMQNVMSICNLAPETAKSRLELILSNQRSNGSAPNAFYPGRGEKAHAGEERCDSPLWSPITLYGYLAETGDFDFLEKQLPYIDEGKSTVFEHLMAGLRQIARDSGENNLPLLKGRDWDDHLGLFSEEGAESVMTAQNWCYAGNLMKEICDFSGKTDDSQWISSQLEKYAEALNTAAWDGEWYRQVLYKNGKTPLGSKKRVENKIYINTQAWAVISNTAPAERAALCLDKLRENLNTDYGIKFLTPPYTGIPEPQDPLVSNGPGLGENGGVFIQANCWTIMAEALLGRGDHAYEYYRKVAPPIISESVGPDTYLNEPYMYSSHIIAEPAPRVGMGNLSWLTGTVNWMYIVATQYILGIRPALTGLLIKPCIPSNWDGFKATRKFRGTTYGIQVTNRNSGNIDIEVDGEKIAGNIIKPSSNKYCTVKVAT